MGKETPPVLHLPNQEKKKNNNNNKKTYVYSRSADGLHACHTGRGLCCERHRARVMEISPCDVGIDLQRRLGVTCVTGINIRARTHTNFFRGSFQVFPDGELLPVLWDTCLIPSNKIDPESSTVPSTPHTIKGKQLVLVGNTATVTCSTRR